MKYFKIILFNIFISATFFGSVEKVDVKDHYDDLYVSKSFSEEEATNILREISKSVDTFDYIAHNNTQYDTRNRALVVIMDNENILKKFCSSFHLTTLDTVKDIETSQNSIFEFILLKTTFVLDKYKNKIITLLKKLFKGNLSLVLNINEMNPTITVLCDSPARINIKNDLIKAFNDFIKTELNSDRYEDVREMLNDKELPNEIINIMISQFLINLSSASLKLFPDNKSEDQYVNTFVYSRTPLTKNSEKIETKEGTECVKELIK